MRLWTRKLPIAASSRCDFRERQMRGSFFSVQNWRSSAEDEIVFSASIRCDQAQDTNDAGISYHVSGSRRAHR